MTKRNRYTRYRIIVCTVLFCMAMAFFLVACKTNDELERSQPTITVASEPLKGTVGQALTLPAATATDTVQGDISSQIKMNVYFERDLDYVYPPDNPREGIDGSVTHSFTPSKVGNYLVTYTVENDAGMEASAELALTVESSGEERAQQLVADTANWVLDENSSFNDEGYIVLAPEANASASYAGKKLKSGDAVEFTFNADAADGVWFYTVSAQMSRSRNEEAPAENEAEFPPFLNMRVLSSMIEVYFCADSAIGQNYSFGNINSALLDGKDHTIGLRSALSEDAETVTFEIWVDTELSEPATMFSSITKADVVDFYGQEKFDQYFTDMFDAEKFGGFFSVGSYHSEIKSDTMRVKSMAINGEQLIKMPELDTKAPEAWGIAGEKFEFPQATAEDMNDYSDLTDRIQLTVRGPIAEGETVPEQVLEGYEFTPQAKGAYEVVYSVCDYSGNKTFARYPFTIANEASVEPPEIVLGGETENLTARVGEPLTLPTVESVTDSDGDDLSEFLTVELLGPEAKSLKGETQYTFYTAGEHTIEYSVIDYANQRTTKNVTVTVASGFKDELPIDEEHFAVYSTMKIVDGKLDVSQGDANGAFKGQKIYSEKVSVLLDVNIASAYGAGDGINSIAFNLRGGKARDSVPGDPSTAGGFSWPNGLNVEINATDGIVVYGGAHLKEQGKYLFTEGTKAAFAEEAVFSWQVTDVYDENGKFTGTQVQIWLNGEEIKFTEDGPIFIPERKSNMECPNISTAGWLSVYVNGSANEPAWIYAITIDGTDPERVTVSVPEGEETKTVGYGTVYTVPNVTAKFGNTDVTSQLKKYVWINSEEEPDYTQEYTGNTISVEGEYVKGFKVVYRYNDMTVATLNIDVNAEISGIEFSAGTENVTAQFGQVFEYPEITSFKIGEATITDGITIVANHSEKKIPDEAVNAGFVVNLNKEFVLEYYYGSILLAEVPVAVTGVQDGAADLSAGMVMTGADGDTYVQYNGRRVYDEVVSVTLDMAVGGDVLDIVMRGPKQTDPGQNPEWPTALRIRFNSAELKVVTTIDGNDSMMATNNIAKYFGDMAKKEYVVSFRVTDRYSEDGTFEGIFVEVWVDGVAVEWESGKGMSSDGLVTPEMLSVYWSSSDALLYTPGYVLISEHYAAVKAGDIVKGIYIGQSIPEKVTVSIPEGEETKTIDYGSVYTFPDVTAKRGETDITPQLKKYVWINGEAEPDYTQEYAGNTLSVGEEYVKGFKVVYRFENKTVAALTVSVNAEPSEVEFSASTENVTAQFGQVFEYPEITSFKLGNTTVTDGVTIVAHYDGTKISDETVAAGFAVNLNKNFVLKYYYDAILLAEVPVEVTGVQDGAVDLEAEGAVMMGANGDAYLQYNGRRVYDEVVSVTLAVPMGENIVDIVMRGPKQTDPGQNPEWPTALRIRIDGNAIKVTTDINAQASMMAALDVSKYFGDGSKGEYTVSFRVSDRYEDGTFKGIFVEVWVDGVAVEWTSGAGVSADGFVPPEVLEAEWSGEEYLIFTPGYILIREHYADIEIDDAVKEIYIGEELPAVQA